MLNEVLLSIPAGSEILGVSDSTTRRLIRDGLLISCRVGRQIRIPESKLREFINNGGGGGWKREAEDKRAL